MFDFINFEPCTSWDCFNSFALWISAVGMVFISAISLWLSIKDKLILVDGAFDVGIIPSNITNRDILDRNVFILRFVNIGRRKVKIDNFRLSINFTLFKKSYFVLYPQLEETLKFINPQFPIRLDEMENSNIFFDEKFFINLEKDKRNIIFHKNYLFSWYKIHTAYFLLDTSIGKKIKIKVTKTAKNKLWKQYKELRNKNEL